MHKHESIRLPLQVDSFVLPRKLARGSFQTSLTLHRRSDLLDLPVALVPPDARGEGIVVEVDLAGEPLTDVPLYRIEQRKPTVYPL